MTQQHPFVFPEDIDGWLSEAEGAALARYASGQHVLEIGAYCGKSTVCMAQTAESVISIDPFDGRATSEPKDTVVSFVDNLVRYQVFGKCRWIQATSDVASGSLEDESFGLVFIDGDHTYGTVLHDAWLAQRVLKLGGMVAFHDYQSHPNEIEDRWDPEVHAAVNKIIEFGGELVERVGSVAIIRLPDDLPPLTGPVSKRNHDKSLVALLQPSYARSVPNKHAARAFYRASQRINRLEMEQSTSLGIRCFNDLLCQALNARRQNHRLTHIAMIHDDIVPDSNDWLGIAMDELEECGADMLSAVVPIKNFSGVTSTAVDMEHAPWQLRRLTINELFDLPGTFTIDDIPADWKCAESVLLLNSGLWVLKLGTWFDEIFPIDNPTGEFRVAGLAFKDTARIIQKANGEYADQDISEDWDWSRQLNDLGLTLAATRKIQLYHERPEFHNRHPWGAWKRDEGYFAGLSNVPSIAAV